MPVNEARSQMPARRAKEDHRLQDGFRLGRWLIEPGELRVSGGDQTFVVPREHMQVLLCLAESRGEFVARRALLDRVYADTRDGARKLREAVTAWHALFGDTARHPRHIAAAGRDGYSLIAHLEPMQRTPIPERLVTAGLSGTSRQGAKRMLLGGTSNLLVEFRRRSVFRVAASYLVGIWILLQVAQVTFAPLHFPAWWITVLTILAVVGMPIVIVLAWTYEITSDGLVRDSADAAAGLMLHRSHRMVAPAVIAGVVLMAMVTGYAWLESIG